MAITRKKKNTITLGNMVQNRIASYVAERSRIRDAAESRFLDKVVNEGLSYDDQIKYRKSQIANLKDEAVPDKAYIKELNKEVRSLGKLNRAQKFREDYLASFEALKTQRKSYQQHLDFLESSAEGAMDIDLKNDINQLISTSKQEKFKVENTIAENQAKFAIEDKSVPLINKAISDISSRRAQALANDDRAAIQKWDSYLRSLKSNRQVIQVENAYNDYEIKALSTPSDAVSMLNFYRDGLAAAGGDQVPMTINGKTYKSMREFWQGNLNNYVQDKFFTLYQSELNNKIDTAAKKLTPILEQELRDVNQEIGDLANLGELKPFAERMDQLRTSVNFGAVQKVGQKVMEDYTDGRLAETTVKNFNIARQKLNDLNQRYNVDVSTYLSNITEDFASKQEATAKAIATGISKGLTPEEAERQTAAFDVPRETVVTESAKDLAKKTVDATTGAKTDLERFRVGEGAKPLDSKTKVEPVEEPKQPTQQPAQPKIQQPEPAPTDFQQITIQKGDTLSGLAQKFGTTIKNLQTINKQIKDPNLIIAGEQLTIPKQQ